ncbi:Neurogenic locus notch likerotein 1 [Schistosoma japonicum]|nr:Neurogenic locus notch likerotein 1 [Schistosoma japonicum]
MIHSMYMKYCVKSSNICFIIFSIVFIIFLNLSLITCNNYDYKWNEQVNPYNNENNKNNHLTRHHNALISYNANKVNKRTQSPQRNVQYSSYRDSSIYRNHPSTQSNGYRFQRHRIPYSRNTESVNPYHSYSSRKYSQEWWRKNFLSKRYPNRDDNYKQRNRTITTDREVNDYANIYSSDSQNEYDNTKPENYFDNAIPLSNHNDRVWNEKEQYWGYTPNSYGIHHQKPDISTYLWSQSARQFDECIPPFCIPAQCDYHADDRSPCTQNTQCIGSIPCYQNDRICTQTNYGVQCNVMNSTVCQRMFNLQCSFGCVRNRSQPLDVLCVCNPWTVKNNESSCVSVDLDIFKCPSGCGGRGQCDPKTRKCLCYPGFKGDSCEIEEGCPPGLTGPNCEYDIDECLSGRSGCESKCVNTYGSFRCECENGYVVAQDNPKKCIPTECLTKCHLGNGKCDQAGKCQCLKGYEGEWCNIDINECTLGTHNCDQICINTPGSYLCDCHSGYKLNATNKKTCNEVSCNPKCAVNQGFCSDDGICTCRPGFTGPECGEDIDECKLGTHNCSQKCVNTYGSFNCECFEGYEAQNINGMHLVCTPKCSEKCISNKGRCGANGKCICRRGFTGSDCSEDINECEIEPKLCVQGCVNTFGSYYCTCYKGYHQDHKGHCLPNKCSPECVDGQGECTHNGSCFCHPGFRGSSCETDVDECEEGKHNCQQECINTPGSFKCSCHSGYKVSSINPSKCEPISCPSHCVLADGECKCECKPGYSGPGCKQNVDSCAIKPCDQICVDLGNGKYTCECNEGFEPNPINPKRCQRICREGLDCVYGSCRTVFSNDTDQTLCKCIEGFHGERCQNDVNECLNEGGQKHLCDHHCINTLGSYQCFCNPDYELQSDGRTCKKQFNPEMKCPEYCLNGATCKSTGECICQPEYEGIYCEKIKNICTLLNLCDQQCFPKEDGTYHCGCDPGYELQADGHSCTLKSDCNLKCENNGKCYEGKCVCTSNFEGERCERDKDECQQSVYEHGCSHGCINTYGSYECICPDGYRRLADKRTCVKENNVSCNPPCQNGGICRPGNLCECTRGFEGIQCELDINECIRLRPCDPDYGICENTPGGFSCQCVPGYKLMYDAQHCIDDERARQQPNLVFRGRGTKGVEIATRLTDDTNYTRYYPRTLKKRSLSPIIKYSLKSSSRIHKQNGVHQHKNPSISLSTRYHHNENLSRKADSDYLTPGSV